MHSDVIAHKIPTITFSRFFLPLTVLLIAFLLRIILNSPLHLWFSDFSVHTNHPRTLLQENHLIDEFWDGVGAYPTFLTGFQVIPILMHSLRSKALDWIFLADIKFYYQLHKSLADDSGQVIQLLRTSVSIYIKQNLSHRFV